MKRILIIRSRLSETEFLRVAEELRNVPEVEVEVADLTGISADYAAVLEAVFEADAAQVW